MAVVADLRVVFSCFGSNVSRSPQSIEASAGGYIKLRSASKLVSFYTTDSIITIRHFSSASLLAVVRAEIAFNDFQKGASTASSSLGFSGEHHNCKKEELKNADTQY